MLELTKTDFAITEGVCEKCMAVTPSGEKVMVKTFYDDAREILAEKFSYELGKKLGLDVNRVEVIDNGHMFGLSESLCSVHWWEDGFETFYGRYGHSSTNNYKKHSVMLNKVAFFDLIILNEDRHLNNFGFLNDKLFIIDNGYARPWGSREKPYWHNRVKEFHIRDCFKPTMANMVERFMSLTEADFIDMLDILTTKDYFDDSLMQRILDRMQAVQHAIDKEKKSSIKVA